MIDYAYNPALIAAMHKVHSHRVHFTSRPPCGVGKRWSSQVITSTRAPEAVTCLACRKHIMKQRSSEECD